MSSGQPGMMGQGQQLPPQGYGRRHLGPWATPQERRFGINPPPGGLNPPSFPPERIGGPGVPPPPGGYPPSPVVGQPPPRWGISPPPEGLNPPPPPAGRPAGPGPGDPGPLPPPPFEYQPPPGYVPSPRPYPGMPGVGTPPPRWGINPPPGGLNPGGELAGMPQYYNTPDNDPTQMRNRVRGGLLSGMGDSGSGNR